MKTACGSPEFNSFAAMNGLAFAASVTWGSLGRAQCSTYAPTPLHLVQEWHTKAMLRDMGNAYVQLVVGSDAHLGGE